MSYKANVFNVMVASPSDVEAEKEVIYNCIHDWNTMNVSNKKIVLLPRDWKTHTSPEMGEPPQDMINKHVLSDCDLLIGVFWTRLGTPTKKYPSGTVEEIERHIENKKPTMLYFSSQPIQPDLIDQKQYMQLKEFKTTCENRGLYVTYNSIEQFRNEFSKNLHHKVNTHHIFKTNDIDTKDNEGLPISTVAKLSEEAKHLLKEASLDKDGYIYYMKYLEGPSIQVNKKNLINNSDRREVAKWEGALNMLVKEGLIIDRGGKGEIYVMTDSGYKTADQI